MQAQRGELSSKVDPIRDQVYGCKNEKPIILTKEDVFCMLGDVCMRSAPVRCAGTWLGSKVHNQPRATERAAMAALPPAVAQLRTRSIRVAK